MSKLVFTLKIILHHSSKGRTHRAIIPCNCYQWGRRYPLRVINAQWYHLSFAISGNFHVKKQLKLLAMAFDQDLTRLIFLLRWACFPIKIGRSAQWEHLFLMYFEDYFNICLIFYSKKSIFSDKMISQWEHHKPVITCDQWIRCHLTKILFYFDDNFSRIPL